MEAKLSRNGVGVLASSFYAIKDYQKILSKLTLKTTIVLGKKRTTKTAYLYDRKGKYIVFPRFVGLNMQKIGFLNIKNCIGMGDRINITSSMILYPYQQIVCDHILKMFKEKEDIGGASCTLIMKPGRGKSYVGTYLITQLAVKTLIVVPNSSIAAEWKRALQNTTATIGEYCGRKKKDGDVVIIIINSLSSKEFKFKESLSPQNFFRQFGFVIWDEVHKYASPKSRKAFWETNRRYGLGLTASPNVRADKFDAVYQKHLGDLLYEKDIPGYVEDDKQFSVLVRCIKYYGPDEHTKNIKRNGMVFVPDMEKQFADDMQRNELIISHIVRLRKMNKNVFVFSTIKEHLQILYDLLLKNGTMSFAPELKTLTGGMKPEDLEMAKKTASIILITYSYGSEGLSIDRFDSIIFATPRKTLMDQKAGRILRAGGNIDIQREIVDIIDQKTSLRSQFSSRKKYYLSAKFKLLMEEFTPSSIPCRN